MLAALFLGFLQAAAGTLMPPGWKIVKDAKGICQVAVPPEWVPWTDSAGAAVFHDATTAIAVVTYQAGQNFQPLTAGMLKTLDIRKEKLFENTAKRIFYQEKTSSNAELPNAYSSSVPVKGATCSCRVVALPSIPDEVVKKIALTLGPVAE